MAASGISAEAVAPDWRQATDETGDRAALWGYASSVLGSPFDAPSAAWEAPSRKEVAELEPNNSFGTAQLVEPSDAVTLAISPVGDADWVRLAVQQGGKLTVHAPAPPEAIDLAVRLVNANGDEVAYWVQAQRPGGELLAEFDIGRPGAYWLQFIDANNDHAAAESFPVNLRYEAQPDLFEPDDRIDLAKHVPLVGSFPLNILPRGDHDWFKFTAPAPGALVVSLTNVPEAIDGAFRLLNADGAEIAYWTLAPRPGGDTIAVLDLPRPGVYYLDVADNNSDASAILPLTLSTRFAPSPDLLEPNDAMLQAMRIEASGTQSLAIFPKGDNDWLELNIVQPGELVLAVKSPPQNLDLGYRVVDGSGAEAQYWTVAPRPGGDLYGSFDVAKPGRYFLQLADASNDASSIEPFDLDLKFTASLDAYEPNDGIGSAQVLTPGGEVPFTILPRGDADWFRVTVEQPGELAVAIDEGPEDLDIAYRVVNSDWNELAYWVPPYRKGGLTEGFVDFALPGTYFLELRDGSNDGRSIEPATLKTVFTPTPGSNEPNNAFGAATPVEITGEYAGPYPAARRRRLARVLRAQRRRTRCRDRRGGGKPRRRLPRAQCRAQRNPILDRRAAPGRGNHGHGRDPGIRLVLDGTP
ncbi:MAG: PPC domain-containing protein [Devosia sp.]